MNANPEEDHLTRWIDGEISEEEAARLLDGSRPGWRAEAAEIAAIGEQLRAAIPMERELPYADFFNHQIRRRIEGDVFNADEATELAAVPTEEGEDVIAFPLFRRLRWLSAAGFAACLLLLAGFVVRQGQGPIDRSEVVSTYTPNPDVEVVTGYDSDAQATVIRLIGAPGIPVADSRTETARTLDRVLFQLDSRELGRPVSVISREGANDEMPGAVLVGF